MVTNLILAEYLAAVIVGMLLAMEAGRRLALRRPPPAASTGTSTVVACCFGLMSLLLAFTFYGAGARFDLQRDLIVQEANALSTAYYRLDLLPKEDQQRVKEMFRHYVRSRLETYQKVEDEEGFKAALAQSSALQNEIWQEVVAAGHSTGTMTAHILLLPSINQTFDIATIRTVALEAHPPYTVIVLLVLTVMVSSMLAGYELSRRGAYNWLYQASYLIVLITALVVTTDYEYPRLGITQISAFDKVIQQALDNMK